jgi:hypothetical protein
MAGSVRQQSRQPHGYHHASAVVVSGRRAFDVRGSLVYPPAVRREIGGTVHGPHRAPTVVCLQ